MLDCEQRTAEWHQARLGKATASKIADIVAKTKSGPSASRANYLADLVAERLTGCQTAGFVNAAMQHGIDSEAAARDAYQIHALCTVEEVGFVDHPRVAMSGASPDGLVGADGLIEVKCPNTATHIATLTGAPIPAKYLHQMMWQMACTERQWCDFVSFDPRLGEALQLHVQRVHRDEDVIAELEREVEAFLTEVSATEAKLRALSSERIAA